MPSIPPLLSTALLSFLAVGGHATPQPQRYHGSIASRTTSSTVNGSSYDFVIVGGGIAGLVLADRLTEDPSIEVLVIESGPLDDEGPEILVPGSWNPYKYFWPGLQSTPLTALTNTSYPLVTAQVVGGGSVLNAMNWIRGAIDDYAGWATLGNPGWDWNGMLPYFKKSENFTAPGASYAHQANISWDDSARGFNGPVQYSYPTDYYPASGNWWSAGLEIGIKPSPDPNAGINPGLFWPPIVLNATTLTRSDARTAYYSAVNTTRPNYHLLTGHLVQKVIFEGKRASAVEYLATSGGNLMTVNASREIIVAAGAYHTPQVLQLSGVGPKKLLDSLNIPVVSDLPGVGTNLQDQTTLPALYNFTNPFMPDAMSLANNATYNATEYAGYLRHSSSAYTIVRNQSTNFGGIAFSSVNSSDFHDIISFVNSYDAASSLPSGADPTVLAGYEAQRKVILEQFQSPNVSTGILLWDTVNTAQVFSLKPLSRGGVTINSTSILDSPILDYRTATDPADFKVIVAMFRKLRELMAAPSMAALGPKEAPPLTADVQSEDDIIAAARKILIPTNAHQCCSAPMMPLDHGGVVDAERKVYGVQGLRIGDVSAFPLPLSAGPTPSVYASAEKLAAMIKCQYGITSLGSWAANSSSSPSDCGPNRGQPSSGPR